MIVTVVKPSFYQDSVALLALARELRNRPGVTEAAALMATPANRELLAQSGLLSPEAEAAGPNDLVIAIDAEPGAAAEARACAEELLAARQAPRASDGPGVARTLGGALRQLPSADLALISVPGAYAAREARRALTRGLHVMLFSDNVAVEDEVALKRMAAERGLLVMGPDCGTAYLGGVPLGFANVVPRGPVGIVAASGTGLQHVAALLAARGVGISHAIGVGGRDMSDAVGGIMALAALDALAADPATRVLVVIGKPPAPRVREAVEARLRAAGKPAVMALLGRDVRSRRADGLAIAGTLEDAALAAIPDAPWPPPPFSLPADEIRRRVAQARRGLPRGRRIVSGLYAGGTLAHEAVLVLERWLGPVASNVADGGPSPHRVEDFGADEHTLGRAHPMIDATARAKAIVAAGAAGASVLLLDIVLGLGAADDPAGDLLPAIATARTQARARRRKLAIVASVIGTREDPQGLDRQIRALEEAGVWVLPSNAQAARAAACIAGDGDTVDRMLAGGDA